MYSFIHLSYQLLVSPGHTWYSVIYSLIHLIWYSFIHSLIHLSSLGTRLSIHSPSIHVFTHGFTWPHLVRVGLHDEKVLIVASVGLQVGSQRVEGVRRLQLDQISLAP